VKVIDCQSEVRPIQTLLLKHVRDAFINQESINRQWQNLNYKARVDFGKAVEEYEAFLAILRKYVPEIHFLPQDPRTGLDSVYVHDPIIVTRRGVVLMNMGKSQRRGEPAAMKDFFLREGAPILGELTEEAIMEGGDTVWIDDFTIAVGQSYRSNTKGLQQLHAILDEEIEIIPVSLPHWHGPDECLHLMSFISPVDEKLAVVYSKLMPVPFRNLLLNRGYHFIEVPDEEYNTMACNILAIRPGLALMIAGNPKTRNLLEKAGIEVIEFQGSEICLKGGGGPTCLTHALWRA
jgi:N-dimethylarginine dimethylaminohydrolase